MAAKLTEEGVTPKAILLTHGHRDHIGAVPELRKHYGIPVYVGAEDQEMLGMRIKIFPPAFSESP
ncbi:MAG: MBL fold metallo-hydrolase [Blautia sp.]